MKFAHVYKLKQDLPTYKKGWTLRWSGNDEKFYPNKARIHKWEDKTKPDIYLDREHQGYSLEQIKDTTWFEPAEKEIDFIPKFPTENKIKDFVYLDFETRLVDDVDECRALNKLFSSKEFKSDLYNFIKDKYNIFHKLK